MNDKAYKAFSHMLESPQSIREIAPSGNEYYFKYEGHVFSVSKQINEGKIIYAAYVYPGYKGSTASLANYFDEGAVYDEVSMVRYGTDASGGDLFAEILPKLHLEVSGRYLNLDEIFDDVLRG